MADSSFTVTGSGGGGSISIGGAVTGGTNGSVLFISPAGILDEDNPNFYWDNTNKRLGIGTNVPTSQVEVNGTGLLTDVNTRWTYAGNPVTNIRNDGTQNWFLTGIGRIAIASPTAQPGWVMFDEFDLERSDVRHLDGGGLDFAAHALGTIPPVRIRMSAGGETLIKASIGVLDAATERLDVDGNIVVRAQGEFIWKDAAGGEFVAFRAPAVVTSSTTYDLPPADGTVGQVLTTNGAGVLTWAVAGGGGGTVTSVDVSGGTTGLVFTGGPIVASGTITMSGTLDETNGGTNQTTYTTGDIIYASAANTLSKLPIGTAGQQLTVSGGIPAWAAASAGGDVVGPASATDNAITRFDGITGKLIQNSGITMSDQSGPTDLITIQAIGRLDINSGGDGNEMNFVTADGTTSGSTGGNMNIDLGNATLGNAQGGFFDLVAGDGFGTGNGGLISLSTGIGGTTNGNGGPLTLSSGNAQGTGTGGLIDISAGNGGATSGQGGQIIFTSGDGGAPNGNAGNITLQLGTLSGTGTAGLVDIIQPTLGSTVQRIRSTATSDDPTEVVTQGRVATTDATVTTIQTIAIPASTTVAIESIVIARRTGGASGTAEDGARYKISAVYKNVAGTATIIGSITRTIDEDVAAYNSTFAISGGNVIITVAGPGTTNVTWHSTTRTYSVSS